MSLISIVVPINNEKENLSVFYRKLYVVAEGSEHNFEFIFVDDGSSDDSFMLLKDFLKEDNRIRIIKFSRNFGSHAACLAGLMYADGDACVFISADLQDPPELISGMIEKWDKHHGVIIGVRQQENSLVRLLPRIYYTLVRKFALKNMPINGTDVFLIDRKVVNVITAMAEKNTSIFGLILWSGFEQTVITYKKDPRHKGISKWTLAKKIKLFIDTFISFSCFPIRIISIIGILFLFIAFAYSFFVIVKKVFFALPVEWWVYPAVIFISVSGLQLLAFGVLGEYLWRNLEETKKRPLFIISEKVGFKTGAPPK
jgi:dolichol-phosphate mannosyltransferase